MKLTVLAVGKVKKKHFAAGCSDYLGRLPRYTPIDVVEIKDEPVKGGRSPDQIRGREAERIRARIPKGALVFALDERGDTPTSKSLATQLGRIRDQGRREVAFIIGGPLGLEPALRAECDHLLALSAFTLPHELARLVLLEQLYRAFTILAGEPYHNS